MDTKFTAYGEELEVVDLFKYLGKLMSYDNNDIQAIRYPQQPEGRRCARHGHDYLTYAGVRTSPPEIAALFYMTVI